jgi:hypothetical protein
MVRKAAESVIQRKSLRQELTDECVSMLYTYRARCTTQHSNGQLVLPEALKVVPLFLSALFKVAAFREKSDVRIAEASRNCVPFCGCQAKCSFRTFTLASSRSQTWG